MSTWNAVSQELWSAGPRRSGGAAPSAAVRRGEFGSDQLLLLDLIASVVDGVAVYDARGEPGYIHLAYERGSASGGLAKIMAAFAKAVVRASAKTDTGDPSRAAADTRRRAVTTRLDRLHLCAALFEAGFLGAQASVLVIAHRPRDYALDPRQIRKRFKLTKREAEVAALLADRRTNAEVARALGISVHTARHHTERVLVKLGAGRRQDVHRVLQAGLQGHGEEAEPALGGSGWEAPQP